MAATPQVEIRRYLSVEEFQADAASMAAAGWIVIAQSETTSSIGAAWIGTAVIAAFIGLLVFWPALPFAIILLVAGLVTRGTQLLVTYRLAAAPD